MLDDPDHVVKYIVVAQSVINGVRQRGPFNLNEKDTWVIFHKIQEAGSTTAGRLTSTLVRDEYEKMRSECTNLLDQKPSGGLRGQGSMMNTIRKVFQGSNSDSSQRGSSATPSLFNAERDRDMQAIFSKYPDGNIPDRY